MIDLFLGSDLGTWALTQVDARDVARVITTDESIAAVATSRGIAASIGNANQIDFEPSLIGFSVQYPRLLKEPLLSRYRRVYNLHPGFLPWGKGYYPVFWALWENTPAGATLHEITLGIDEGRIVDQIEVKYTSADTGATLLARVREAEKALFGRYWPAVCRGEIVASYAQPTGGSYHSRKEFVDLKACANWADWRGNDLIRLIRCLTMPQYTGFEVTLGGQRFDLKVRAIDGPTKLDHNQGLP